MARSMKDSEVEWIGEIPVGWTVTKVLNGLSMPITDGPHTTPELFEDGIVFISAEAVSCGNGKIDFSHRRGYISNDFYLECCKKYIPKIDDIYMIKSGATTGRVAIVDTLEPIFTIWSPLAVFRCNDAILVPKFLFYQLQAEGFQKQVEFAWSFGTQQNIGMRSLEQLKIVLPALSEQARIANFLDVECTRIDAVIKQTRASIEEYKKLKQSVITQAVTKGIRPDRKMKDSGVEWIGEIPEEWASIRLQHTIAAIESGTSVNAGQAAASDGELGVLKTSCVSRYVFLPEENKNVNKDEENRVSCPVRKNTIIVSRMNTPDLVGACGYVSQDYDTLFLPDRLWQVHFKPNTNVKYIYYWLRSACIRNYYSSLAVGTSSSMQNISQDQFYHASCPYPTEEEQKEIVAFLDEKCNSIDYLIDTKSKSLTELESYKKSLIFEYVTGKKVVI